MGAVMICRDEPVKTPYYIESMGIRLYSMEELAFFLYENVYLADRQMLGKRLWEWLRTEAHNPDLAEKLKKGAEAGSSIQNMVLTILRSVDYYTREELTELSSRMKVLNTYQEQERLKLRPTNISSMVIIWRPFTNMKRFWTSGRAIGWVWSFTPMSGTIWASATAVCFSLEGLHGHFAHPGSTRRIRGSEGVCLFHAAGTVRRRF